MEHTSKSDFVDYNEYSHQTWLNMLGWTHQSPAPPIHYRRVHFSRGDLTRSSGHRVSQLGKTKDDIGGDFQVLKREMSEFSSLGGGPHHFSLHSDPMDENAMEHYHMIQQARFLDISPSGDMWPEVIPSSDLELITLGTTAIARCTPTTPLFDTATFLGDLREGLPRFQIDTWKDRILSAKGAGSDYLNYQFGWLPLVSDIRKFVKMTKTVKQKLDRYQREAGKLLHRRYNFDSEYDNSVERTSGWDFGHLPVPTPDLDIFDLSGSAPELVITRNSSCERWFKGAFMYYLPPPGWALDEALAQKALGIEPTPEMYWELTPWSWAIDWVSNAGDYARNVSNFGGGQLVMPYGYMMEKKISKVDYELRGVRYKSYPGEHTFRQTFTTTVKKRVGASPYGFGLTTADFTPRQIAILAAIGITHARST